MTRLDSRGVGLLEVLVAVALLAIVGLSVLDLLIEANASEARLALRERELLDADRLLTAYSLLDRKDLDARLGTRTVGQWMVEVQRPRPSLYRVGLSSADRRGVELLVTILYRERPEGG